MCPLRYVLLGFSALLAVVLLMWPESNKLSVDLDSESDADKPEEKETSFISFVVDGLTGRYLWKVYRQYFSPQKLID